MQFTLLSLARLLDWYYQIRPLITALFFTLLLSVSAAAQTAKFTLQLASCDTREEAETMAAQLLPYGINAVVSATEGAERRTIYRVRAGSFASINAAKEMGEQWKAAQWIQSYWVAKAEKTATSQSARATLPNDGNTRKRVVTAEKSLPEMGLGELIKALSDKWMVRVPENLKLYSAAIVFPKAGIVRPVMLLMDEARLRTLTRPAIRELRHPLELRLEPGIKNSPTSDGLKFAQVERLATSLRSISGYCDLNFDERGILVLGSRVEGGSDLARTLLQAALAGNEAFEIESLEGSDLVVFGAFINAHFTNAEHKAAHINKIQLDFHDFDELRGDARLLEAFDPGFVFLHELAHGVWDLSDDERGGLGECEVFINQIRRQLGLPERLSYFYKIRRQVGGNEFGELLFVQPSDGARRRQALKLQWNNRAVNSYFKPPTDNSTSTLPSTQPK